MMPASRSEVLVLRCCGTPVKVIAARAHKSESAVRQDLQAVHRAVFDPLGLEPDSYVLAWWVLLHRECCLADSFDRVATG
jgi:hypothetical protein